MGPQGAAVRSAAAFRGPGWLLASCREGHRVPYHLDEYLPDLDLALYPEVAVTVDLAVGGAWARLAVLYAEVAGTVAAAARKGACPVVLSGDCTTALGTVAGLQRAGVEPGVVWLDAHGAGGCQCCEGSSRDGTGRRCGSGLHLAAGSRRCRRDRCRFAGRICLVSCLGIMSRAGGARGRPDGHGAPVRARDFLGLPRRPGRLRRGAATARWGRVGGPPPWVGVVPGGRVVRACLVVAPARVAGRLLLLPPCH
jgi:arginase family protein